MESIARNFDNEIAKLYIATTVEAAIFSVGMGGIIFFFIGFTAFAILQTIGMILLAMLLGKAILKLKKKQIRQKIKRQLEENCMTEEEFSRFLSSQTIPFEFLNPLFLTSLDASCQKS